MPYYVRGAPGDGYFTDLLGNPLSGSGGIYELPPDNHCIAIPLPGYAFACWIGAYCLNPESGELTVLNWWGGNYVEGLFTQIWDYTWDITNGSPPYTVTVGDGGYPPGLTPNEDGTIASGGLIEGGDYPITVTVTDSTGATSSVSCDISVPIIMIHLMLYSENSMTIN